MVNNTPKTMTYHQIHRKKCLEKGSHCYKQNKKRVQKITLEQYKGLPDKQKDKKREYIQIDMGMCLKNINKN